MQDSSSADKPPAQGTQPVKRASGLLGQWLARKEPQQSGIAGREALKIKTGPVTETADPGTPTWSESSETSDFASVEAHFSPAAKAASSEEPQMHARTAGQQAQARLAGRLGGWLSGVTNAAGDWLSIFYLWTD